MSSERRGGHGWMMLLAVLGGGLQAWLLWRVQGSDSDFAGLCCFAESLSRGINPANPYFPPGYPALLWLGVKAGLSCLQTAALLSGLGAGLAIYHLSALWRRFGLGVPLCLLGGALPLLLPDMIWTFQMAHTDGLMLGLLAVFLHAAIAIWRGEASRALTIGAAIAGAIAALSRWHLALILVPVLLVLLCTRSTRRQALALALLVLVALTCAYGLLYSATGSFSTSARLQIFTGLALAAQDNGKAITELTNDYAAFADAHRQASIVAEVGWARIIKHTLQNFLRYMTVRATLGGLLAFALAGLCFRAWPRSAGWLALLAIGYSLAISPSYFVHRASCVVEWCGIALFGAALAAAAPRLRRWGWSVAGVLLFGVTLTYSLPRATLSYDNAIANRRAPLSRMLHELYTDPHEVVGWNAYNWCPGAVPWNLPSASLNRLWVDDHLLDRLTTGYPRYTVDEVLAGRKPVKLIIINERERWPGIARVQAWAPGAGYRRIPAPAGYELWAKP